MKLMAAICLCLVVSVFSLVGCSNKENNINNENNSPVIIKDNPNANENTTSKEIENTIKEYFNSMEKHNVEDMKKLFTDKLSNLSDTFDFDYVESVNINKISEANYNDEGIKVYTNYIKEEYNISLDNIKIFEVSFNINTTEGTNEEGFQKFAFVKDENTSKWLICEMFR